MSSLTAFIVADGEVADEVRRLVESWTKAGILEPSLWVTPENVVEQPFGPPMVRATYVHSAGTESVDLFEHIGRLRLTLMRLVSAHFLVQGSQVDHELVRVSSVISDAVRSTLPQKVADTEATRETLHRTVLAIPASGTVGADPSIFRPDWDVNAVIAAEDRPDLDRSSVFVRHPGNYSGHASAALAAIGGILRGVDSGVLDGLDSDSTSQDGDVVVARVSVRSVIGEDVLDVVSTRVLDSESIARAEPVDLLSWARPASQPESTAAAAAAHLLASEDWASRPAVTTPELGMRTERLGSALRSAARFNVATTGAVLSWLLTFGRARAERSFTNAISGERSGVLVTLGARPADDLERVSAQLIEQERNVIDQELQVQSTRVQAPAPSTWQSLRRLAFALVDGGDLGDFPEPRQSNKRELLQPHHVVSVPGKKWDGREGVVMAHDPIGMRIYKMSLEAEFAAAKDAVLAAQTQLEAAIEDRDRSAAPTPEPAPKRASSSKGATASPADEEVARLEGVTVILSRELDDVKQELDRYSAWFRVVASAMVWQVADDVARRASKNAELQESITKQGKASTPASDSLKAAQRTLRTIWIVSTTLLLALSAFTVYLRYADYSGWLEQFTPTTDQMIYVLVGLVVLALIVNTSANHVFYKAVRRYERDVEEQILRLRRIKDTFLHAGREKSRFEYLYRILEDWVFVIGELLHKPWSPVRGQYEDIDDDIVEALPAAMGVARQASTDDSVPTRILLQAAELIYTKGWASHQFDVVHENWENDQSSGPNEGYRAVDLDTSESITSPLHRLREFFATGEASRLLSERARGALQAAVVDGSFELPDRVVSRVGRYGDGMNVAEPGFYRVTATETTTFAADLFAASARQRRLHYVARSLAWIPNGARLKIHDGPVELRDSAGSTAVRVDISRKLPASELTTFGNIGPEETLDPAGVTASEGGLEDEIVWH